MHRQTIHFLPFYVRRQTTVLLITHLGIYSLIIFSVWIIIITAYGGKRAWGVGPRLSESQKNGDFTPLIYSVYIYRIFWRITCG